MIQITISEKDNPKVAGWLMDNNIEYSSKPIIETGKNKPFIVANVREILDLMQGEEISYSRGVELLNEVAADYYSKQPVPVSVGYRDELEKLPFKLIPENKWDENNNHKSIRDKWVKLSDVLSLTPTEQQDKGDGWD